MPHSVRHVVLLPVLALLLAACASTGSADRGPDSAGPAGELVEVVTAVGAYAGLVEQIGGERVRVRSLVPPTADPHDYEPTVEDVRAVARASLVVVSGLHYDDVLPRLVAAQSADGRVVLEVAEALGEPDGADPHLWLDPVLLPQVVDVLAAALMELDAAGAADYRRGAAAVQSELAALSDQVDELRAVAGGREVLVTEPVATRLLRAGGLVDVTPRAFALAVENGGQPAARDVAAVGALLSGGGVAALLQNTQTAGAASAAAAAQAREAGVPVVEVREGPPEGTAVAPWLRSLVDELRAAVVPVP